MIKFFAVGGLVLGLSFLLAGAIAEGLGEVIAYGIRMALYVP